jgi:pseudaminic acid biosynthesis-associated methylase
MTNLEKATDQERLWAGAFGTEYIERNRGVDLIASNSELFRKILQHTSGVDSVLELGANIGNNLHAIRSLLPRAELHAVEINPDAARELRDWGGAGVTVASILDFAPNRTWDLVFTKGVLIHINPDRLSDAYERLVSCSRRYVMVCEYYNPTPVEVLYRDKRSSLFKRDFAGEMLDRHPELSLLAYGFTYHRDPEYPLDDSTWFLMEKRADGESSGEAGSSARSGAD